MRNFENRRYKKIDIHNEPIKSTFNLKDKINKFNKHSIGIFIIIIIILTIFIIWIINSNHKTSSNQYSKSNFKLSKNNNIIENNKSKSSKLQYGKNEIDEFNNNYQKFNKKKTIDKNFIDTLEYFVDKKYDPCFSPYLYFCSNISNIEKREENIEKNNIILENLVKYGKTMKFKENKPLSLQNINSFYNSCIEFEQSDPFESVKLYDFMNKYGQLFDKLSSITFRNHSYRIERTLAYFNVYDIVSFFKFTFELNPLNTSESLPTFCRDGLTTNPQKILTSNHRDKIYRRLSLISKLGIYRYRNDEELIDNVDAVISIEKKISSMWPLIEEEFVSPENVFYEMKYKNKYLINYKNFKKLMNGFFDLDWFFFFYKTSLVTDLDDFESKYPFDNLDHENEIYFKDDQLFWVFNIEYFQSIHRILQQHSDVNINSYFINCLFYSTFESITINIDNFFEYVNTIKNLNNINQYLEKKYTFHATFDTFNSLPWTKTIRHPIRNSNDIGFEWNNSEEEISKYCFDLTLEYLPSLVSYMFQKELEFNIQSIPYINDLAFRIKEEIIYNILPKSTSEFVINKIKNINIIIGSPMNYYSYSKFSIFSSGNSFKLSKNNYLQNIINIRKKHSILSFELLAGIFSWNFGPYSSLLECTTSIDIQTIAILDFPSFNNDGPLYNSQSNAVYIPISTFRYPFYSDYFDEINYLASIGIILTHEIFHSISPKGLLFDSSGSYVSSNLDNYFNPLHYQSKLEDCLIKLFTHQTIMGNTNNGIATFEENFADYFALKTCFSLLEKLRDFESDKFNIIYKFSLSFSQLWCSYPVDEFLENQRILKSSHSIKQIRTDINLLTSKQFISTFQCGFYSNLPTCYINDYNLLDRF